MPIYVIFALLIMHYLFNSVMMPSNIMTYMNGIEKLGGTNFAKWKGDLILVLVIMDRDHSFTKTNLRSRWPKVIMTSPWLTVRLNMRR
jgi:hypothetical protein